MEQSAGHVHPGMFSADEERFFHGLTRQRTRTIGRGRLRTRSPDGTMQSEISSSSMEFYRLRCKCKKSGVSKWPLPCVSSLTIGSQIGQKFCIGLMISKGAFGRIHEGVNLMTGETVAIKLEYCGLSKRNFLRNESAILQRINVATGFPRWKWFGSEFDFNILVMERLGPSLGQLLRVCEGTFSLKTVLMLADQCLALLERLHNMGYVHADVKPENFVVGLGGADSNRVYLIDFGLSRRFIDDDDDHIREQAANTFIGTPRYASINAHRGIKLSRSDDLESLGYVFIEFLQGRLPWKNFPKGSGGVEKQVGKVKLMTSIESLCEGLPNCFSEYLKYCRDLKFTERPQYDVLRGMFQKQMNSMNESYDCVFDWNLRQQPCIINPGYHSVRPNH